MILSPAAASVSVPVADGVTTNQVSSVATGGTVNVTGAVVYASGTNASGDTVGAARSSLGSPGVVRTTADGGYSLELSSNASHEIVYAQGDVQNGTDVFPRDGSVDLYALGNVTVGTNDIDLGRASLPTGYVVDVFVNDTNGDPVEGAQVAFIHRNQTAGGTAAWGNATSADGHVYPYQDPESPTNPGLELAGTVQVLVLPPNNFEQPIVRNLTVNSSRDITVTLPAPPGGNLTVDDAGVADHVNTSFVVRNESDVDQNATYYWSFGDGEQVRTEGNTTSHLYRSPGTYTVQLNVANDSTETLYYSETVDVTVPAAGTADLVVDPNPASITENVSFRVKNVSLPVDQNVSFYNWEFGDGGVGSTQVNNTTHAYTNGGTYTVEVTARNQTERLLFTLSRNVTVGSGDGAPADGGDGGGGTAADPWPTFGQNAARTGYNPGIAGPQSEPSEIWSVRVDERTTGTPAIVDGVAYVSTGGYDYNTDESIGRLYGFDTASGGELLNVSLPSAASSTPTVANGVVYVGTENGRVFGYTTTGTEAFNVSLLTGPGTGVRSVAADDGRLYVTSTTGSFSYWHAYDPNGTQVWSLSTQLPNVRAPAVDGGTVYVAVNDSLRAVGASDGATDWSASHSGELVGSAPSVAGDYVYHVGVAADNQSYTGTQSRRNATLYAHYTANGSLAWAKPITTYIDQYRDDTNRGFLNRTAATVPAVVDGTVYVGGDRLYAFDATTGTPQSEYDFGETVAPRRADALAATDTGTLYATFKGVTVQEEPDSVYAFRNGQEVWNWSDFRYGLSHPSAANETLLLTTDRAILALSTAEPPEPNQPPDAVLGANRTSVRVGDPVRLDGTDSIDPDGSIIEYRWDTDGDGTTDTTTQSPNDTVVVSYQSAGSYDATLTAVDNDSATDSDTMTITVQSDVTPTTGAWPQFHYDTANGGYNASAVGPAGPVEIEWKESASSLNPHAPVVWNGRLYNTGDERLNAYNASTGQLEWGTDLTPTNHEYFDDRFDLTSSATVVDGVAYVGAFWNDSSTDTAYEIVYAVDATTGNELWNVSRPVDYGGFFDDGLTVAEPKVTDGKIIVTSAPSDSVFVLDAGGDHAELWNDTLQDRNPGEVLAPPAVSNGRVFVTQGWDSGGRGYIYAFNLTTGAYLWSDYLGFNYDGAAPTAANGTVYVARDGDSTLAYDAATGTEQWSSSVDGYAGEESAPAVTESLVIVGKGFTAQRAAGISGGVRAFDRDTGALVWEHNASDAVAGAPAVAGTRVYFGAYDGTVYGLDVATGSERWTYQLPTGDRDSVPVIVAPAVVNGTLFIRSGTNGLVNRALFAITDATASGAFDADLVASPQPAYANVTNVTLSLANASGTTPDSYEWDFGDGTTASTTHPDANASHVYGAPGTYTARVTAYDTNGTLIASDETTVEVRQPSGVLIATPTTADVNVTNVSFRLVNVTGASPQFYSWDLDGDGQFEDSTAHPNNTTNYTYARLLGATTARVVVSDDDEQFLFDATEVVDVVDRIPPVARATAPTSVKATQQFTVDASNSTDNHRIANYTFDPDNGSAVTQPGATATVSFATAGNHTVNVTVTDASGNTNTTAVDVFVREAPDLTVDVAAPPTQQLGSGATATLTVHNNGTDDATGVQVRLNTSARVSYYRTSQASYDRSVGDLAPGESTTVTVDFTDWADDNVSSSRPRVDLLATVDPGDTVAESDETNNVAENATDVGYSDLYAYVYVPYRTIPSDTESVSLRFYNDGSLPSPTHNATVSFGDDSQNVTVTVPEIDDGDRYETTLNHTFAAGRNTVRVNVTDDPRLRGNVDTDTTRTAAFTFRLERFRVPDTVERDETFYVYASGRANYDADQNATIELPDGLELTDRYPRTQNRTEDSYHTYRWEVRAVNESGAQPFTVNVTGASRNLTDEVSTTIEVLPPRIRLENSTSVAITDNGTETTSLDLRGETTYDHSLSFSAQLGPQGRTLDGLEYLFDYPNYCVEQTTSPMLAALNTDQYYRENPAPGGYNRGKVNDSVAIGVERMTTGDNAQHANGAWSMYGDDPRGDMYYTAYALFGVGSVAADSVQGSRPGVAADLSTADFNQTVFWLEDNQETDGRLANDKFYFEDDAAMTGFGLVALERAGPYNASATAAADGVRANATAYLVGAQNADGSWGDGESNAMSTALAVWGLAESGVDTPAVNAAIADGSAWLVANQNSAGAWTESRSGSWRATGTTSETTAYAVLALNATGVPASNQTISEGTTFLVATYDNSGSWGYTRASAVAIETLLTLGVEGTSPSQNVTVKFGNASNPALVTKTVTVDDGTPRATVTLSDGELATLRAARGTGPPIQVTVEAEGSGQLVVGLENDQVVNADEYEANGGA
ncbi:PKD domain-containing protein [Halorarius litoreus]|uniref:PKD domain-containing protein n=1 Tax=Halorarius litoreus TaxID=2962676 RepID=UPI0020CE68A7|nr:PKD domain-containing protein [Halorarius litoreus]